MKKLLKIPAVKNLSLKRRKIDEAIEVAKIYRTDVYWEGKIAWSYSDWVKSKTVYSMLGFGVFLGCFYVFIWVLMVFGAA